MNLKNKVPNARKWTEERVTEHLATIKYHAFQEDVDYLGIALIKEGLYIQLWAYWKKIFANDDDIIEEMMMIESIFEARLVQAALRKKVSPWVAIFSLKNNHQWTDRPAPEPVEAFHEGCIFGLDENTIIIAGGNQYSEGTYIREPGKNKGNDKMLNSPEPENK